MPAGRRRLSGGIPLVRRDVVACDGPRLLAVLDTVSARLTTGSLRALDARVELRGQDPRLLAESWLGMRRLASIGEASH
jgi:glycine betaine/choline ABC-type transport system substrate-binding protein